MLFDRTCATHSDLPRRASLDDKSAAAIRQTNGRELLHAFWGRYVAFLPGPGGLVRVIRDPTGELDCLTMNIGGVRVFFNFVDQCPLLEGQKLSVNWDYVASAAAVYLPETLETGFIEITRVLRGECLEVCERGLRRQLYWDPSAFAAEGGFDDVRVAESAMFRTASHCINAWASCYGGVIPLLSGGLDSSILLGLLMQSPRRPPVTALTYYYLDGSGSDERYYARASAAHAGSRLIEHEINPGCSFENLLQMPKQSGPCNFVSQLAIDRIEEKLAQQVGADARFRGHGGDELFFSDGILACADLMRSRQTRLPPASFALSVAQREQVTIWHVLADARKKSVRCGVDLVRDAVSMSKLLNPDAAQFVRTRELFLSPWLSLANSDLSPGKAWQVAWLGAGEGIHGPFAQFDDPEDVAPLCAQPLLELCLRIPTYVLMFDGRARALARRAFRDVIPSSIRYRHSKGAPIEYAKAVLASNRDFVRETLLNGQLVKNHILDRGELDTAIAACSKSDRGFPLELFTLTSIETWLSSCAGVRVHIAA